MKKILLTILLFTASTLIYSQSMDLNHKKIHIVDSTMGLGITPTSRLHVFGNGTASNLFNVTNDKDATKDSSVVIDAIGNVGIGKTPTSRLEVVDGLNTYSGSVPLAIARTMTNNKIAFIGSAVTNFSETFPTYNIGLYGTAMGGTNNFAGYFNLGNVYVNENLGIGKETPTSKLEVTDGYNGYGGSVPLAYFRTVINDKIAVLGSAETNLSPDFPAYNIGLYGTASGGTNNFAGYFNRGDVYINNNLGIGRLAPTYRLDIFGNGGTTDLLKVSNDINSTYDSTFVVNKDGKVGIGTTTPAAALHIKGAEQIGNINTLIADSVNAIRLSGTATVWDVLTFPFSTGNQVNVNYPPFNADSLYFEFSIDSTGTDAQFMYFIVQMPHSWKEGSTIYPHVHYKYEDAVGACSFRMKYKWFNIGSTTAVGWKWAHMNITSGANDKNHAFVRTYSGINGSGKTISSILICKVYLYGISGTGTCKAYQFDIHYEKDALGSNTEREKN